MKIAFICGSLELGKDGVGDYVRRLSGELIRAGHSACILALNDKFIQNAKKDVQLDESIPIPTYRLSSGTPKQHSLAAAEEWMNFQKPDKVSLQFVPYAFQKKGLPFGLTKRLNRIAPNSQWHVMFHELWLGINRSSGLKHLVFGKLQKSIVKQILRDLSPTLVTTTNELYRALLERRVACEILPLFGNTKFDASGFPYRFSDEVKNADQIHIGVFGGIESPQLIKQLGNAVEMLALHFSKKVKVFLIGSTSHFTRSYFESKFPAESTGFIGDDQIAAVIRKMHVMLGGTNIYRFAKSGASALSLELARPVLVGDAGWTPRKSFPHEQNLPPGAINLNDPSWLYRLETFTEVERPRLQSVADQFLKLLVS